MKSLVFMLVFIQACYLSAASEVKKESSEIKGLVMFPENCLDKLDVCGLKTETRFDHKVAEGQLMISKGSEVVLSRGQLTLLSGMVLINSKSQLTVKGEYGEVVVFSGSVLLESQNKKMIVYALSSEVNLDLLGHDKGYMLNPGYKTWISGVDFTGKAHIDIAQPAPAGEVIKKWSKLYPKEKEHFKKELAEYKEHWRMAVQNSSLVFKENSLRSIANHNKRLATRRARRRIIQRENQSLRALFRKKNYLD